MAHKTQAPLRADARHPGPHRTHPRLAAGDGLAGGLTAGGTEGNERLTVLAGLLLIVLLAALGVTIIRIGQLLWLHLFLGLLLIGPVALKMATTGYRFVRYYTHSRRYRVKGPPVPVLRLLAPAIVGLTIVVFASGVVLLFIGPGSALRSTVLLIHKASFIVWIVVTAVHVLGHLPEILRFLHVAGATRVEMIIAQAARTQGSATPAEPPMTERLPGETGRWLSLATAIVLGAVLAIVLIPDFGSWTSPAAAALLHHHHFH
jgi:hypothetical protein